MSGPITGLSDTGLSESEAAKRFVPLPARFFAFLVPAIVTYLGLVELAKRRLFRHSF